MPPILSLDHVSKTYDGAGQRLTVLDNVSLAVEEGSTLAVIGPSGSGKTTLLGLCAGLDRASAGRIELSGVRLDTLDEVAHLMHAKWSLGIEGAILLANPVPADREVPSHQIETLIAQALREAEDQGVKGKDLTPFLLERIASQSHGESLEANIALVLHNAAVGAQLACRYATLGNGQQPPPYP